MFYVYAYLRNKSDEWGPAGSPYYIGKGKEGSDRENQKHRQMIGRDGTGMRDIVPDDESQIVILKSNLSEEEAYALEADLISFYGRVDLKTGSLWNLNEGGTGGQSGYVYPEYLKEIRRQQLKGNNYGSRVDWSNPEIKERHKQGLLRRGPIPKTAKGYAADENLKIPYNWEHPTEGKLIGVCCMDMERKTGKHQGNFWAAANGKTSSAHGWICQNPRKKWEPKVIDAQANAENAAATRIKKNASELGITVEEYNSLSYSQRSRLRKKLGIPSEVEKNAQRYGLTLKEYNSLSTWDKQKLRNKFDKK